MVYRNMENQHQININRLKFPQISHQRGSPINSLSEATPSTSLDHGYIYSGLDIKQFAGHAARWKKPRLHGELVDFRGVVLVDDDDPQETSFDLGRL